MLIEVLPGSLPAYETYIFPIRNNSERTSFEPLQIRFWKSESAEGYFGEKTAFFSNKASRCGILTHLPFAPTRARAAARLAAYISSRALPLDCLRSCLRTCARAIRRAHAAHPAARASRRPAPPHRHLPPGAPAPLSASPSPRRLPLRPRSACTLTPPHRRRTPPPAPHAGAPRRLVARLPVRPPLCALRAPRRRPLRRHPLRACVQVVSPAQAGNSSLKPAFPAAIMLLCVCVCMDTPGRVVRRSRGAEPPSALKRQSSDLEERKGFLVCGEAREQESRGAISAAEASQPRKRGRPAWKER